MGYSLRGSPLIVSGGVLSPVGIFRTCLNVGAFLLLAGLWAWQVHTSPHRDIRVPAAPSTANTDRINLEENYNAYNKGYFLNKLPHTLKFTWGPALNANDDEMQAITHGNVLTGPTEIELNPRYAVAPAHQQQLMLHEMCHIATWADDLKYGHKGQWKNCMLRLANAGAFDEIW